MKGYWQEFILGYSLQVVLLIVLVILTLWGFQHLPAQVPVHWNINGQPDRIGSRAELLFTPWVFIAIAAFLEVLERKKRNDTGRQQMLQIVSTGLLLIAVYLSYSGIVQDQSLKIVSLLGFLFIFMGNTMGRVEPNRWVGLRTPWVYRSRRAWYASQRRGGYTFMALGALACGVGLLPLPLAGYLTLGWTALTLLASAGLVYASYLDYKADPDPQPVQLH